MNQTNLPIHGMGCSCSKCSDPRGTPIQRHRRFLVIMVLYLVGIVIGAAALLQGASAL
ncbi:hypothetical protein C7451_12312 [Blastomonas natatoria]|uniref:Uncharacterized protein n=1 Tax=Blastomonas natatoria TaxID=34015 RepID=A0A2V3V2B2_9SPHN|nr:hypothetical protein [Blastomonas natatoria]PXW67876.1 hypothetical protein C7451_12312 [Blastomonas natatoria]